eukprot:jgi/Botrbrau1/14575/Bobra.0312s0001.1
MGRLSGAVLGCCLLLSLPCALCFPWCKAFAENRRQLADFDAEDQSPNILTDGNWTIVFQEITQTRGSVLKLLANPMEAPFSVTNFSASMEMSSNATYQNGFDSANRTSWGLGFTRVNVSVDIALTNSTVPPQSVTVKIHTLACSLASAAGICRLQTSMFKSPTSPKRHADSIAY